MTMKSEGLNQMAPECFAEISAQDAKGHELTEGDFIKISSRRGEIEARTKISDLAVKGTIFLPFHYAKAAANKLTNAALDPTAKIPEYKVCAVKIKKI
jgi:predicted molibdopterin-dependent oxidoreductase YjgC